MPGTEEGFPGPVDESTRLSEGARLLLLSRRLIQGDPILHLRPYRHRLGDPNRLQQQREAKQLVDQ